MCSKISAVLRGLSDRNALIFCLILTVFIFTPLFSKSFDVSLRVANHRLSQGNALADITVATDDELLLHFVTGILQGF